MCIVCRPVIVDGDAERNNYMKNIIDGERISIKLGKHMEQARFQLK